jgi:hypothetical protein
MIGVLTGKEPPMKDTARKKDRSQGTPHIGQLALSAMFRARETLYETVVHAGMGVLAAMLEEDRTRLCGHRYEHADDRRATRGGHTDAELPFGGRRVRVRRPRVRGSDGREVPLPTWQHFADADPLTSKAVEQMVLGVSTRNYDRSLEPTPAGMSSRGASKSAVSRRFVSSTEQTLTEMMGRDLSGLAICALIIDGTQPSDGDMLVPWREEPVRAASGRLPGVSACCGPSRSSRRRGVPAPPRVRASMRPRTPIPRPRRRAARRRPNQGRRRLHPSTTKLLATTTSGSRR